MDDSLFTITFPFDARTGLVLTFVIAMVLGSAAIFAVLKFGEQKSRLGDWQKTTIETLTVIFTPIWIMLMGLVLWSLIKLAAHFPSVTGDEGNTLRWHVLALVGLLTALGGLLGTPLALIRVHTTERQTRTAEQGLITDQISKAVEQLGADKVQKKREATDRPDHDGEPIMSDVFDETVPNVESRIGGLYALERIKNDSLDDHIQIMEIICAYIRENSKWTEPPMFVLEQPSNHNASSIIQIAIEILARRSPEQLALEASKQFRLNLRGANLQAIHFMRGDFSAAIFDKCNLRFSNLVSCRLHGTRFNSAHLEKSTFHGNDLTGARFDFATVNHPRETWTGYFEVSGILRGASFIAANMPGVSIPGSEERFAETFGTKDSLFAQESDFEVDPDEIDNNRPRFKHWSRWPSTDLATYPLHNELLKNLGLDRWPYID